MTDHVHEDHVQEDYGMGVTHLNIPQKLIDQNFDLEPNPFVLYSAHFIRKVTVVYRILNLQKWYFRGAVVS